MKKVSARPERVVLFASLLLLLSSTGWVCWWMAVIDPDSSELDRVFLSHDADAVSPADETPAISDEPPIARIWEAPRPQASGPEWIYDLFTPPTIYRRPGSDAFLASLPEAPRPVSGRPHPDFDLMEVRPALFRLQLVGFAGRAGNFFGLFENTATTEHFLAATDQLIPALGLRIERFRVIDEQDGKAGETIATAGLVAEALVRDETSGEEVVLTDGARTYEGEPMAVIGVHGGAGETFTLRRNETIEREGVRYRLRDIRLDPPQVDLAAESPAETEPEMWTLTMASEGGS